MVRSNPGRTDGGESRQAAEGKVAGTLRVPSATCSFTAGVSVFGSAPELRRTAHGVCLLLSNGLRASTQRPHPASRDAEQDGELDASAAPNSSTPSGLSGSVKE